MIKNKKVSLSRCTKETSSESQDHAALKSSFESFGRQQRQGISRRGSVHGCRLGRQELGHWAIPTSTIAHYSN